MKYLPFFLIFLTSLCFLGCKNRYSRTILQNENTSFFGDSVLTIISNNRPNGYSITILKNKDLCIWHFQRGDSINRYLALDDIPYFRGDYVGDSIGVYTRNIDIPTSDTLIDNGDFYVVGPYFFMDVNFDGEAEFILSTLGHKRIYYVCFDLLNGNENDPCIGFLSPMNDEPYNNIVGGLCGKTVFDYQKQLIYIYEDMGAFDYVETWAKPIKFRYEQKPSVRVFKRIKKEFFVEGYEHTTEYRLVNDTLKEVSNITKLIE